MTAGEGGDYLSCFGKKEGECPVGSLLRSIKMDTVWQETMTGLCIAGAWIGSALFASWPMEHWGRRPTLLTASLCFILGSVLCALSENLATLGAGRFILGLAVGVEGVVVPALLSEMALVQNRGKVTVLHQLMVTIGILSAGLIGYFCVTLIPEGWRWAQAVIGLPACLQLLLACCCFGKCGLESASTRWGLLPESPSWLLTQGREEDARSVMYMLHTDVYPLVIEAELEQIKETNLVAAQAKTVQWKEVFMAGKPVAIGLGIMIFQALCGINTVIFYSSQVFAQAGVTNSLLATVCVGVVNVLMTIVSMALIDRIGRKILLVGGTWTMLISLVTLSASLMPYQVQPQGLICVTFTLLYIVGFAVGFGAVGFVIITEIVPFRIRSKAMSLFLSCNWMLNLLLSLFSLSMIDFFGKLFKQYPENERQKYGVGMVFALFGIICLFSLLFIGIFSSEIQASSGEITVRREKEQENGINELHSPNNIRPLLFEETS